MTSTVNLGIVAHVDAGKTSLTERLLYDTGAIDRLGRVDDGDTRTDTGRVERERGITVRTAVAPFHVGDTQVNLIDTPGHADFVAEVERALTVLDGAVLVLSAVEGVQPHTRLLMRVLERARIPTLLFVNKVDRSGADPERVLERIARLTDRALPMDRVVDPGGRKARVVAHDLDAPDHAARVAEFLAEHDEQLLADLVEDRPMPDAGRLHAGLRDQVLRGLAHPVLSGSAVAGAGIPALLGAITGLLSHHRGSPPGSDEETRGTVFAIECAPSGEKTGYVRLFSGRLERRERRTWERADPADGEPHEGRVTHLEVVGAEHDRSRPLTAGGIGRVRGLPALRVGDRLGPPVAAHGLSRPALEALVRPERPEEASHLHAALTALAEQDPLIGLCVVPGEGVSVLLHGEVQKEVVADTLATDFGVRALFGRSATVHVERPIGVGTDIEEIDPSRQVGAPVAVGLRVEPASEGSGVTFRRETELGALPPAYDRAVERTVLTALGQGLYGWPVTDCVVTLVRSGYDPPLTEAAHFRRLVPMVVLRALERAGSRVFEPVQDFELEAPEETLSPVLSLLGGHGARVRETGIDGDAWRVTGEIAAAEAHRVGAEIVGVTRGEGVWTTRPAGERPLTGAPPRRRRTDGNPLVLDEYLVNLANAGRSGTD
ncbi:translation factor GTPase family protein [Nocardiopsis alba]|uniref:Translation factor GTPase family protein n=1 Tax=Nocardiopsis alba TaxID=53437 RepID=A0ABV5DY78_9ACTN